MLWSYSENLEAIAFPVPELRADKQTDTLTTEPLYKCVLFYNVKGRAGRALDLISSRFVAMKPSRRPRRADMAVSIGKRHISLVCIGRLTRRHGRLIEFNVRQSVLLAGALDVT